MFKANRYSEEIRDPSCRI